MPVIDELLAANRAFAESFHEGEPRVSGHIYEVETSLLGAVVPAAT